MERTEFRASFSRFSSIDQLSDEDRKLMQQAIQARQDAYAPYSGFSVGASVLLDNGKVVTGNNQENGAYPSGMCAERVAIWSAASRYPKAKLLKVMITASSDRKTVDRPVPPCGACRQAMAEYELRQEQPISVFFSGASGEIIKADSLKDLLPFMFDNSML